MLNYMQLGLLGARRQVQWLSTTKRMQYLHVTTCILACVEWMPVEMVQGSLESQCMAVKETERSTEEEGKACWKKLVPLRGWSGCGM